MDNVYAFNGLNAHKTTTLYTFITLDSCHDLETWIFVSPSFVADHTRLALIAFPRPGSETRRAMDSGVEPCERTLRHVWPARDQQYAADGAALQSQEGSSQREPCVLLEFRWWVSCHVNGYFCKQIKPFCSSHQPHSGYFFIFRLLKIVK